MSSSRRAAQLQELLMVKEQMQVTEDLIKQRHTRYYSAQAMRLQQEADKQSRRRAEAVAVRALLELSSRQQQQ